MGAPISNCNRLKEDVVQDFLPPSSRPAEAKLLLHMHTMAGELIELSVPGISSKPGGAGGLSGMPGPLR